MAGTLREAQRAAKRTYVKAPKGGFVTSDGLVAVLEPLAGKPVRVRFNLRHRSGRVQLDVSGTGDLVTGVRSLWVEGCGDDLLVVETETGGVVVDAEDVESVTWLDCELADQEPGQRLAAVKKAG
jgi:hypothetical protein